jgi:predicted component of type VI protein secretion system
MIMSWSDDEEADGDGENEFAKHIATMTGRIMSGSESSDEDLQYKEMTVSYTNQENINTDTSKQLEE